MTILLVSICFSFGKKLWQWFIIKLSNTTIGKTYASFLGKIFSSLSWNCSRSTKRTGSLWLLFFAA